VALQWVIPQAIPQVIPLVILMERAIDPRFKNVSDFPDMSFLWRARITAETPTE
jgi:hypothetical protein